MNRTNARPVVVLLAALVLAAALPVSAHDDGLTCHHHGSVNTGHFWVFAAATTNVEAVEHNFANLLAAEGSVFQAADLSAARRGLSELDEMVTSVYLLVVRAERMSAPGAAVEALDLAQTVFEALPLARYAGFESFLRENRLGTAVVLPIEVVSAYLRTELAVPGALVDVIERAAESC